MRDTKRYVGPFIVAHPNFISPIQTPDIDAYLGKLKGKARSKNNMRDGITGYFNFAQEKGYLPQGIPHAASLTPDFRDACQKIESEEQAKELLQPDDIYLPEEMSRLQVAAKQFEPAVLPTMEIKAFSGVRTEEMVRLWWVIVCEPENLIRVPDAIGKVDARRVPILPNLKNRLAAHPDEIKRNRVAAHWNLANSLYHAWQRVCQKAGVPYRRNAFRNSCFTYRLAIVGDPDKVAEEGGTSAGELKKNYLSRAAVSLGNNRALAEPVSRNRPGRRSRSTLRLIKRNRSGTRCTSSRMLRSGRPSTNPSGSDCAAASTTASSKLTYSAGCPAAVRLRTRVVLPDWRGPWINTTGVSLRAA